MFSDEEPSDESPAGSSPSRLPSGWLRRMHPTSNRQRSASFTCSSSGSLIPQKREWLGALAEKKLAELHSQAIEYSNTREAGTAGKLIKADIATSKASLSSILFSSMPVTLFLGTSIPRGIAFLIMAVLPFFALKYHEAAHSDRSATSKFLRVGNWANADPWAGRKGEAPEFKWYDLLEVGPTMNGWRLQVQSLNISSTEITVELPAKARFNGIFFRVRPGSDATFKHIFFNVVTWNEETEAWDGKGFWNPLWTTWHWEEEGNVAWYNYQDEWFGRYGIFNMKFVDAPTFGMSICSICAGLIFWLGKSRPAIAKVALAVILLSGVVIDARSAYYGLLWDPANNTFPFVCQVILSIALVVLVSLFYWERWILSVMSFCWLMALLLNGNKVWRTAVWYGFVAPTDLAWLLAMGLIPSVLVAWNLIARHRAIKQSFTLLAHDRDLYNSVYEQLIKNNLEDVMRLKKQAQDVERATFNEMCIQLNRRAVKSKDEVESNILGFGRTTSSAGIHASVSQSSSWIPGNPGGSFLVPGKSAKHLVPATRSQSDPVRCLDQLFNQAQFCQVCLLKFCLKWAFSSSGYFRSKCESGFVLWDEASQEENQFSQILWPSVKSHKRAVEKLFRNYKGDISKLVDLARGEILFENIPDLVCCLRLVSRDPNVHIVRIKNKLDPDFQDPLQCGYRDVHLNLRLISDEAIANGIENHIAELQLMTLGMSCLKSQTGHKKYVEHRNLLGK